MKVKDYLSNYEPFLLYLVLFFPSVFTNSMAMSSFFTSHTIMINYIIISIPQILLIIYFFHKKEWNLKDNFSPNSISRIFKTAFFIIIYTFLLIIIASSAALMLRLLGIIQNVPSIDSIKQFIPFYILVSVITGYREELFFRAYLINFFEKSVNQTVLTLLISAMFAICHISQGLGGILISFFCSIFLCFIFFRERSIHINAISHALYNFVILLAVVFSA